MKNLFTLVFGLFLLSGCGSIPAVPAPTGAPSATPGIVFTPTSVPTATPVSSPTPEPEYAAYPVKYFGVFNAGSDVEEMLNHKFSAQLYYHRWESAFSDLTFEGNAEKGWITMPTWEYRPALGFDDPNILHPLQAIVEGDYDYYIRPFAQAAAAFGKPVLMRFGHEMNGDWYPWSGTRNGGAVSDQYGDPLKADGPERFVDAFRYLHRVFAEEGAENVLWVWCPNVAMTGALGEAWNAYPNYYPGDEYVDWLCVDGYNWGTSQSWSQWQSFDQVYAANYAQLQAINPSKPMMIGEFASSEKGGDKAAWVTDMFARLPAYPQIRMIFWFNINKETDWRMNSSEASLKAFQQGLTDPIWAADPWPGIK